jgi:hypothetical protein
MTFVSGFKIRNMESFQKKKWNRETWAMVVFLFLGNGGGLLCSSPMQLMTLGSTKALTVTGRYMPIHP